MLRETWQSYKRAHTHGRDQSVRLSTQRLRLHIREGNKMDLSLFVLMKPVWWDRSGKEVHIS